MKSFKTESKRVLDLMINSIYTHKEIFLRELISNCSDAIDKLYFKSLSENISGMARSDFHIDIILDKENRTLKISDNGIGMGEKELETNLGTIAKSGSLDFKTENKEQSKDEDINIIGQFGVGFYSAFMVSDKVEVVSKAFGADKAFKWTSSGVEGYEIEPCEKEDYGTEITLYIKNNNDNDNFDKYLEEYGIRNLVKKYSDYIRYPIRLLTVKTEKEESGEEKKSEEWETLNSMTPIWKKNKNEIKPEEYDEFYKNEFYADENPLHVIHTSAEGTVEYKALLFIPAKTPYDYYSKNYEKGLKLFTDGVLITDKCKELLPDYFGFVKGLVDTELTLNISRETIQHGRELKLIASSIEKKIKSELADMLNNDREKYEKFFESFGLQLKYGIYSDWGMHKDVLKDLVIFKSVKKDKMVTLAEYVAEMGADQKFIYYVNGKNVDAVKALPQTGKVLDSGYDVLCFSDEVDEFAVKIMGEYNEKRFCSVTSDVTGIDNAEAVHEGDEDIIEFMKECLGEKVAAVKFSKGLKEHAVCLSSQGELSIEMEKTLNHMPNGGGAKAEKVLEINDGHPIFGKIKSLFDADKEGLKVLTEILFEEAMLIAGLSLENPTQSADRIIGLLSK